MTTPNQPAPDGAISGGDLSPLDGLSESAWRANVNARVMNGNEGGWNGTHSMFGNIFGGLAAIFNGWFGGGGVGTPQEVQYTIEAIKQAIINGYTVDTIVTSGSYVVPQCTEVGVILIGGGENGQDGRLGQGRALGGRGGGYTTLMLDAPALIGKTLSVTIGASGSATTVKDGATTLLSVSPGYEGGISTGVWGFGPTTSGPGAGGEGGLGRTNVTGSSGSPGQGTPLASGGTAGNYNSSGNGGNGGAGGNVSAGSTTKCGGAGGGGGGGGGGALIEGRGGAGGPGGYPGGGGGGGGGAGTVVGGGTNGAGGIGAVGCAWFVWK